MYLRKRSSGSVRTRIAFRFAPALTKPDPTTPATHLSIAASISDGGTTSFTSPGIRRVNMERPVKKYRLSRKSLANEAGEPLFAAAGMMPSFRAGKLKYDPASART